MSGIDAVIVGNVVADPETRNVGNYVVHEFPLYVNHNKLDKATGSWVKTGDVSKIRVSVWGDKPSVAKGDLIRIEAGLVEKNFTKRDGSDGRQMQTEYVKSIEVLGGSAKNVTDVFGVAESDDIPF